MHVHVQIGTSRDEKFNNNQSTSSNRILSLEERPEVHKIRKRVLIIVGILFGLALIDFTVDLSEYANRETDYFLFELVSAITAIIYYGFGFFCARRYLRTGLLVFVWFGTFCIFAMAFTLILLTIFVVKTIALDVAVSIVAMLIIVLSIYYLSALLLIFAIRYAYVLFKLLNEENPLPTAQI